MKQITVNFSCFLRCAVSVQCFPVPYTEPYPAIVLIYTIFLSQSKNREPLQIVVELNFKKLPRYLLRFLCLLKTANRIVQNFVEILRFLTAILVQYKFNIDSESKEL